MDLCSLAEICTRFQQIIRRIFPTKLKINAHEDNKYSVIASKYSSSRKRKLLELHGDDAIEIILRNFGPILLQIKIMDLCRESDHMKSSFLLNLVWKYCVEILEDPDICSNNSPQTVKSKPFYNRRLQALELRYMDIRGGFDSSANFDSLIELKVDPGCSSILEMIFRKLERFYFKDSYYIDNSLLRTFISRHPNLTTLHIDAYVNATYRTDFLQEICNSCRELVELSLDIGLCARYSFLPLQSLKRLKTLQLFNGSCTDLASVPAMTNLRELSLYNCRPPRGQFDYLMQLTKLRISRWWPSSPELIDVIRRLIHLEEFEARDFRLNEQTFAFIVEIVQERSHVLTLKCDFRFPYDYVEDQKVRLVQSM